MPDLLNLRVVDMDELSASTKGRTPTGPMRLRAVQAGAGVGVPAADALVSQAQGSNGGSSGQAGGVVGHDGPGGPVTRPGRSILALDPGTIETGWVIHDGNAVLESGVKSNAAMLAYLWSSQHYVNGRVLAIEMIASYGMPVGREVFETCVWIGRFMQAWHSPEAVRLVYRRDVKLHLCGTSKAKDPNVRQALIDLFPATGGGKTPQIGTKGQPGPLYGVSSHAWPALGVAITACHQMKATA